MNREELIAALTQAMDEGEPWAESARGIFDWLTSIGYEAEPKEPGYAEAGMNAVGDSIASLYLSLRARNIPKQTALELTKTFIQTSMASMLGKE